MHERMSARKLQTSIRWCTVQLYVACVTPILGVDAWAGTAIFSVARPFHFAEKLEKLGLIGDVSSYHIFFNQMAQGVARCGGLHSAIYKHGHRVPVLHPAT